MIEASGDLARARTLAREAAAILGHAMRVHVHPKGEACDEVLLAASFLGRAIVELETALSEKHVKG